MSKTVQTRGLELRLLGPLEARRGGTPIALGGRKPRALLADLAVHLGEVVSTDRLMDDVWGERPPASAAHAVEVYVSKLRRALEPASIASRSGGYALELDPECVDSRRFERLVDQGRTTEDPAARAALLGEGLSLWRGPPLADLTYEPFAQGEIARLEELRAVAVEERIEAELALGHAAELVPELEALVTQHPFRERLCGQLMLALYRAGRQADALAAFRATRRTLLDELGMEPGPELRALETAIIRQDEELLTAAAPPARRPQTQRKLATILFADIDDSTGLTTSHDPETVRGALDRYFELASAVLAEHGGTVEKFVGDAVMAVFGIPVAHEDDALRAAQAALDIRAGLAELNDGLERDLGLRLAVQIGLETGEVVTGDTAARELFATGEAVNVAARLQQAAAPGEVVLGPLTARLIGHAARLESLGTLALRGISKSVPGFRLIELAPAAASVERRLDAPLVGRADELTRLRQTFARVVRERTVHAASLLGPAGIGKSRLAAELASSLGDEATVLTGRCLPYGRGITFWPARMIVREAAGGESREAILALLDGAADAQAVADRLAEDAAAPAEEVVWAFRLLCEFLATRRPLLLVLDDLHWAEPTLLDLVEHLADRSRGAPILVLGLAREELLEERPGFLGGRDNAETLALDALSAEETETLVAQLATPLAEDMQRRIAEAAEGNPLFLEQLVALAAEDGLDPERPMPATIQALLLARLDRLGPGERAVLERAAVIGKEFWRSAVADLLDASAAATARRHLDTLVRRGFLHPAAATTAFEEAYRFRHGLIESAAYGATPKGERAQLHERFAEWLDRRPEAAAAADLDALVGYHLEQAYRYRAELAPVDRHARGLAADAGARLGSAGIRAWKRGDARATTNLLGRSTALLPESDATRRELLCELGVALRTAGESERAEGILQDAVNVSLATGDRRVELRARIELTYAHLMSKPQERADELLAMASEAIPLLEAVGDDRSLGRAWLLSGFVHGGVRCHHAAWLEGAESAAVHYQRAGWPVATCLGQIAVALYHGPTPVAEAIARCEEILRHAGPDRGAEANVRVYLGGLEAQRGRFDMAGELVQKARALYDDLGQAEASARNCGAVTADIALLADDPVGAEHALRLTCETLEEMRDFSTLATRAADLAEALYVQGRYHDAEVCTHVSEQHAGRDDVTAQTAWRSVRAKVLARRGDHDDAAALAWQALRLIEETDALNQRAKTLLDLAEVLRVGSLSDEARIHGAEAVRLYELKGNTVGREKARAVLDVAALA
ncbi:MAG TPA: BTAD domain-containing putative transcriptional regulator [Gaiellaceae bacterium]|jgi:class 3 adenylate cyclase/tetratricopeptide (TPR) repeat protein